MSQLNNLYLGKAGEFLVMSHFLMRGWNVAVPEVDRGDDIFVIEDTEGIYYRIQVKTASAIYRDLGIGTATEKYLIIYFSFEEDKLTQKLKVTCSDVDISEYVENFNDFPVIQH